VLRAVKHEAPLRLIAIALLAGLLVVALLIVRASGAGGHRLAVVAPEARFMRAGLEVRAAGKVVGSVDQAVATRAGTARVLLRINDGAWPLPAGTTATFRWAGTIAFTNRYVELTLPPSDAAPLRDGATIAGADVTPTVEVDQIAALFNRATRRALRRTLQTGGAAFQAARPELPRALNAAPPALAQARALLGDLGADREALDTLVRSADALTHAIDTSKPGTRELLSGAATTLQAVASRSAQLQTTLGALPATLGTARSTLSRADGTLRALDGVLRKLEPGVAGVREISRPLKRLLRTTKTVAPQAQSTLASLRVATSDLNPVLDRAPALLDRASSVGKNATPQLQCIRPYTPEVAGLAGTWTGFLSHADNKDKYARVTAGLVPHASSLSPVNSADWLRLVPGMRFAFPRPPGLAAGQPWFLPACGVGPESLDASKDPEGK
jgi:virulence factor Mce-like protein